ncbi:ABC transporter permease subunit [Phytoactinopolyspora sp. XMNu-373]|uniref:ABC transporter permease subunit n=2 Tax=Phytoactinopolyspora mesophila TaxID=2650750 RepID=A0A7K3LYB0_9ACTN|nr:ABC transporter permease subunit [Phytoactinopolyspora mesophila]
MAGVLIISVVIALGLLAPLLGGDPARVDPANRLRPPSSEFLLGTDEMGRDLWTILLYGARTSIGIAGVCTLLAIILGYLAGVLSGYFPAVDAVVMRIMDGLMSFPNIILVMALIGVIGNGIGAVVFGLTVVLVPPMARVVRSATLAARELPMVESAVSLGARTRWILTKYVAPEAISVVIVQATMAFSMTVLSIAALSFLGIGLPPDVPSWGASLSSAQQYFNVAWWIGIFPGAAILVTVLGLILLGDGLRDVFDPRSSTVKAPVV